MEVNCVWLVPPVEPRRGTATWGSTINPEAGTDDSYETDERTKTLWQRPRFSNSDHDTGVVSVTVTLITSVNLNESNTCVVTGTRE